MIASVTGRVAAMGARVLGLDAPPTPADASDALALAICHAWRQPAATAPSALGGLTPAQRAWQEAEKATRRR